MNSPKPHSVRFGGLEFDPADGSLQTVDQSLTVRLRPRAATLLAALLERAGEVVDRETLQSAIWGKDAVLDFDSGLAALLRELRKALSDLGADSCLIETLPRRGYRLNAQVSQSAPDAALRRRERHNHWRIAAAALFACMLVAVIWWSRPEDLPASTSCSLAILPPEWFATDGSRDNTIPILLADHLLAELWRAELEHLDLIGRTGMQPYLDRDDVASAVADDLGVNLLIEGSVMVGDSGWRFEVRLLQMPGARIIWSQSLAGEEPRLPVDEAARAAIAALAEQWPELRNSLPGDAKIR